jgi:acetate kinase
MTDVILTNAGSSSLKVSLFAVGNEDWLAPMLHGAMETIGTERHFSARGDRLRWLGAVLDPEANRRSAAVISTPASRIEVRVIPTDEEAMIARHTLETIRSHGESRLSAA